MIRVLILVLIFFSRTTFAQSDEIILPELDLVIDDQSSLNTLSTEEAILKERTPQFQEVYLEELLSGIADASLSAALSQKNNNRVSQIQFSYGSFNNTQIKAVSQNLVNNLFYKISYQGQFRQNTQFDNIEYPNTSLYNNYLDAEFSMDFKNTIINIDFSYDQNKMSFINNLDNNQYTHYIPITVNAKYWIDEQSHLNIKAHAGFTVLNFQNTEALTTKESLLIDGVVQLSYKANFVEWNYFEFDVEYHLNDYSQFQAHTGLFRLKSDFLLGKGFNINVGFGLISSSVYSFYLWPEIVLGYNYLEIFALNFKISGDFNLYNAEKASRENQFYSLAPTPESRLIYSTSIKINPIPYFWMGADVQYSDYNNKRIYAYDEGSQLYSFINTAKIKLWSAGVLVGAEYVNIFNIAVSYYYSQIDSDWLLFAPHKLDILMNIGYKRVGFDLETRFTLYAPRNLRVSETGPWIHLLNFKISQKIYNITEIFLEINNVLNQNIRFISGTYYGGIQVNGGVVLNF